MSIKETIYLAPLQGFTDFNYRKCYHQVFGNIDEYYIPYISIGSGSKIRNSQHREILPENNGQVPVVPQILCGNVDELKRLATELKQFDYPRINLNLGCPYPMATKKGRGTGLLENTEMLKQVLDSLFSNFDFTVSVKFRAGLENENTILKRTELLKSYPFEKLIFHPRNAKQLYKGVADRKLFAEVSQMIEHPLVYNGDVVSNDDLAEIKELVPNQNEWMIGRGILTNPFLSSELNGVFFSKEEKLEKLLQFHDSIFESHVQTWSDHGIALNKLEQFWSYFSLSFVQGRKIYKAVKKAKNLTAYHNGIAPFLNEIV